MAREKLIIGSTNMIELVRLRNRATGLYPINAVVTADLLTAAGGAVAGGAALPVTYDSGTGDETIYRGAIPYTVTITEGAEYIVRVTSTSSGVVRRFDIACVGAVR